MIRPRFEEFLHLDIAAREAAKRAEDASPPSMGGAEAAENVAEVWLANATTRRDLNFGNAMGEHESPYAGKGQRLRRRPGHGHRWLRRPCRDRWMPDYAKTHVLDSHARECFPDQLPGIANSRVEDLRDLRCRHSFEVVQPKHFALSWGKAVEKAPYEDCPFESFDVGLQKNVGEVVDSCSLNVAPASPIAPIVTARVADGSDEPCARILDSAAARPVGKQSFLDERLTVRIRNVKLSSGNAKQKRAVLRIERFEVICCRSIGRNGR